jgi:hypothetical protein
MIVKVLDYFGRHAATRRNFGTTDIGAALPPLPDPEPLPEPELSPRPLELFEEE